MNQILKERVYEISLHKKRLKGAMDKLKFIMPLDVEKYNELDEMFITIIDQMLFRFTKLQDTMGDKIFPLILELQGEAIKKMSFIDRLNRLEELEVLSKDEWMNLRDDRNIIAHEYSYNEDDVVENINFIYQKSFDLLKIYDEVVSFIENKNLSI